MILTLQEERTFFIFREFSPAAKSPSATSSPPLRQRLTTRENLRKINGSLLESRTVFDIEVCSLSYSMRRISYYHPNRSVAGRRIFYMPKSVSFMREPTIHRRNFVPTIARLGLKVLRLLACTMSTYCPISKA